MVEIEGVRIFGSPYVKKHGQTAFGYRDGSKVWADIPPVDILMTHGPPYGIADIAKENKRVGCEFLLEKVMEIRPKFHIFGHIHESGGQMVEKNGIVFANVSQCGSHRKLTYKPFKFEIAVNGSDR
jgi:Icc-related predicted phosphoesterase